MRYRALLGVRRELDDQLNIPARDIRTIIVVDVHMTENGTIGVLPEKLDRFHGIFIAHGLMP